MSNDIKVGSVVFYAVPNDIFTGPGTVTHVDNDEPVGITMYTVMWQSSGVTIQHTRRSLKTLAEHHSLAQSHD